MLQSKRVQQSDTVANFHVNHKMMETSNCKFSKEKKSDPHSAYCSFNAFEDGLLKVLNAPSTVVVGALLNNEWHGIHEVGLGASCDWKFFKKSPPRDIE